MFFEEKESYFVLAGEPWDVGVIGGPALEISVELRDAIIGGPTVVDDADGNRAYVFGIPAPTKKQFASGEWRYVGYHRSRSAATSLLDLTDDDRSGKAFVWSDALDEILPASDAEFDFKASLFACRALDPRIMWMASVPGGHTAAELHVPAEDEGKPASSLIINIHYYDTAARDADGKDASGDVYMECDEDDCYGGPPPSAARIRARSASPGAAAVGFKGLFEPLDGEDETGMSSDMSDEEVDD